MEYDPCKTQPHIAAGIHPAEIISRLSFTNLTDAIKRSEQVKLKSEILPWRGLTLQIQIGGTAFMAVRRGVLDHPLLDPLPFRLRRIHLWRTRERNLPYLP
jgi:hypothetical protein